MRTILIPLGVIILAAVPFAAPSAEFVLTIALAKGLAALGVALLLRAGLISLGHAMFFAIGAYATAFLSSKLAITDIALLLLLSTVIAAIFGALFGLFLVRYRAIFFAMLNLAVSMVLYSLFSKLYGITGGTDGIGVTGLTLFGQTLEADTLGRVLFYAALLLVALVCWLAYRYLKSPLGHALSAVHSNEIRLEYIGTSAWAVLLSAYTFSAAIAGLGGAVGAMAIGRVLPEYAFWTESGHLVLTAILGGIGGVIGPVLGSVFLELVHTAAAAYVADAWNMIVGAVLLIVIFFLPDGLYGLLTKRKIAAEEKAQ